MNRTKIEWTNFSWNPVTGCDHGCWYCYAKKLFTRFHKSFEPMFHVERLDEIDKLKKPAKVFVCSVSDLFADWTLRAWYSAVILKISNLRYSHLTFQLLTKEPQNISKECRFPTNVWIGCTVSDKNEIWKIEEMKKVQCGIKFISFEPLLSDMPDLDLSGIDWVIIGKLTGSKKIKLNLRWMNRIYEQCLYHEIPIFMKNNLKPTWLGNLIQEFPR